MAKNWQGISSYQKAGGASRRAGGEIPHPSTLNGVYTGLNRYASSDCRARYYAELAVSSPSSGRNRHQYSLHLHTEGWPGWVGLENVGMVYPQKVLATRTSDSLRMPFTTR